MDKNELHVLLLWGQGGQSDGKCDSGPEGHRACLAGEEVMLELSVRGPLTVPFPCRGSRKGTLGQGNNRKLQEASQMQSRCDSESIVLSEGLGLWGRRELALALGSDEAAIGPV